MAMKNSLFCVSIAWSQTDHENVLVSAKDVGDASEKVKKAFPGVAGHLTGCQLIHHAILGKKK